MKILAAEDDAVARRLLQAALTKWGHEVTLTANGTDAWNALQQADAPSLLILDWLMPGMDGVEICRRVRQRDELKSAYILLLTSRGSKDDIVEGLQAGADDYVTKPFDHAELRARLQVGARVVQLQTTLAGRVRELEEAMSSVKMLEGLLPICCYCNKIRDDSNYWHRVESYITGRANVRFSHGICPDCTHKLKADLNL
jgi:sigma-B regulation protein RsbU (phosphoserine phosphatase)